jgi:hypothetical protein
VESTHLPPRTSLRTHNARESVRYRGWDRGGAWARPRARPVMRAGPRTKKEGGTECKHGKNRADLNISTSARAAVILKARGHGKASSYAGAAPCDRRRLPALGSLSALFCRLAISKIHLLAADCVASLCGLALTLILQGPGYRYCHYLRIACVREARLINENPAY